MTLVLIQSPSKLQMGSDPERDKSAPSNIPTHQKPVLPPGVARKQTLCVAFEYIRKRHKSAPSVVTMMSKVIEWPVIYGGVLTLVCFQANSANSYVKNLIIKLNASRGRGGIARRFLSSGRCFMGARQQQTMSHRTGLRRVSLSPG